VHRCVAESKSHRISHVDLIRQICHLGYGASPEIRYLIKF
jgi:hypothetical protein